MPCWAATRASSSGAGSELGGSGAPTARTKASKPAGVEVTSQRASVSDAQRVRNAARREDGVAGAQDVRRRRPPTA